MIQNHLALISKEQKQEQQQQTPKQQQQQQPEQKEQKKKGFFVIKRRSKYNLWMPVALYDEENHYRGIAVFEDFYQAIQYQKKFEDRLIKQFLKERKPGYENANDSRRGPNEVKLFIESEAKYQKLLLIDFD